MPCNFHPCFLTYEQKGVQGVKTPFLSIWNNIKSRQCEGLMCARAMIAMSIFDAKESKSRANQTPYQEEEVLLRI